ncbi:MAG: hypothetical protein WC325_12445, partial [Candidatus Bathyarchaeia archaeon]
MKKTLLTTFILFTIIVILVVGIQNVEVVEANWIPLQPEVPPPLPPTISITSPETRVYHEKEIEFNFNIQVSLRDNVEFRVWNETTQTRYNRTLQAPQDKAGIPFISYKIDDTETILKNITAPSVSSASFNYAITLTNLSEGIHTLTINASGRQSAANLVTMGVSPDKDPIFLWEETQYSADAWSSSEVTFIVDTAPPTISIASPKNKTYSDNFVQLAFTVDEPVTWTGYSLDNAEVVPCNENTVITGLSNGAHRLVVYANDTASTVGVSETVYFTVQTVPAEPVFSMPKEYLNYTITTRNGTPWAIVDGTYPMYCPNAGNAGSISMAYPTHPNTINILIKLNETQLSWTNFTEQFPDALHHTVIGDWAMIETSFTPSEFFVLSIHYEHPIT